MIPEAGTDYDPSAVIFHNPNNEKNFFGHGGDHDFDPDETRFLDPATDKLLDSHSIQFFDIDTGEIIDPDSAQAAGNGFHYEIRSDDALSAFKQAINLNPEYFGEYMDVTADIAQRLDFRGFQDLGSDAVLTIVEAMGQTFVDSDGSVKAGVFNSLDDKAFQELGSEQVFEALETMQGEDFDGMSGEQTSLIFETIGLDQTITLDPPVIAGIVGRFNPDKIQELGGEQVVQIIGALGQGELEKLGDQQALSMTDSLNVDQIGTVASGQIAGLTTAINAIDIGNLGEQKLVAIVNGLEPDDLSVVEETKAGEIFKGVGDGAIVALSDDSKDAALDALNANFFGTGSKGFEAITPKITIIDQVKVETPRSLADLLKDLAFYRSTSLLRCASAGNCTGVVDRGRPGPTPYSLTTTSSPGGSVNPSGTTNYNFGDFVTVTATALDGFIFVGWSGACGGDGGCTLSMDRDQTVRAEFIPIFTFTLPELPDGFLGVGYPDVSFCDPKPTTSLFCGGPLTINPEPTNPSGGTPNYTFSHSIGLPLGLTLNSNGVLTGTIAENSPTGPRRFDVCATDRRGIKVCRQALIDVRSDGPPLEFSRADFPDATVGEAYPSFNFKSLVSGGVPFPTGIEYRFSHGPFVEPNYLPPGLTLLEDGTFGGTPKSPEFNRFEVCVTDSVGDKVCQLFDITINASPAFLSGTWSGSHTTTARGDAGCTYNNSGSLRFTLSASAGSVSGSGDISGMQLRFTGSCGLAGTASPSGSVSGTFSGNLLDLTFNFLVRETGGSTTYSGTAFINPNSLDGEFTLSSRGQILDSTFSLTKQ